MSEILFPYSEIDKVLPKFPKSEFKWPMFVYILKCRVFTRQKSKCRLRQKSRKFSLTGNNRFGAKQNRHFEMNFS